MRNNLLRFILASSIVLIVTGRAMATPFTFVDVEAGFSSANLTTAGGSSSLSISGTGIGGIGTATSTANADFGTLGIFTAGSATPGPQVSGPTIVSRVEARFQDLLFIGGVDGEPVDVTLTLDLSGSCSTAWATTSFTDATCLVQASLAGPASAGVSIGTSSDGLARSITIPWVGNSAFPIAADVLGIGSAYDGSFTADFAHTLHTYVWSSTPGVVITSESGHDYSPAAAPIAAPEPASLVLLGSGMIAVACRRRRKY